MGRGMDQGVHGRDRFAGGCMLLWCHREYAERPGFMTGERLTGAYALGPEAGEWLQQATVAIRARVPLPVLFDVIQPFPSFSEAFLTTLSDLEARTARDAPEATPTNGEQHEQHPIER